MPLPQDISPPTALLADRIIRLEKQDWIVFSEGQAWLKVLHTSEDSGSWAAVFRWKQGYIAPPHKHLSSSHTWMLKGEVKVGDRVLRAGDYVFEANGSVHDATTALSDSEYLFICNGPLLFFDEQQFTGYLSWEELEKMRHRQ